MRISFAMQSDATIQSLDGQQEQINTLSNSISSGQKLASPTDDPSSWSQSMNVKQGLREYDSILSNIDYATAWGNSTDSALNQLSNLVSQAQQTAISAASATSADGKTELASTVDGIIKQAVNVLNAQSGSTYVFGGSVNTSEPFTFDASGNVVYNGDTNAVTVKTQRSASGGTPINLSGSAITDYQSGGVATNLFTELSGLKTAITNGDAGAITKGIGTLQDAFDNISSQSSIAGERLSTLSDQKAAINTVITNEKSKLSDLQDTDMAAAVVKLQQQQTAYQAAAQVTSMVSKLNLANYL
jgi:flagellar hook-associated protein 3 FlgL